MKYTVEVVRKADLRQELVLGHSSNIKKQKWDLIATQSAQIEALQTIKQ